MASPDAKKHSTRFDFEKLESITKSDAVPATLTAKEDIRAEHPWAEKFKPSFYVPKPVAERAKRIRVTIEEVE
jgi:hypothetical protein